MAAVLPGLDWVAAAILVVLLAAGVDFHHENQDDYLAGSGW